MFLRARSLCVISLLAGSALVASPAFAETCDPPVPSETTSACAEPQAVPAKAPALPEAVILTTPPRLAGQAEDAAGVRAIMPVDSDAASRAGPFSGLTLSANAAVVSEYRFRGVNLSGGNLALQGGLDLTHTSGFYVGTWASTLDDETVGYGDLELDLYGGWSGEVAEGLIANVGFLAYVYPDAPAGDFDYYEVYASLAFTLGPVSTTLGVAYDPEQNGLDFGGLKRDNLYTYTDVGVGVPGTPFTINGHLGYTDGALSFKQDSKSWDWSIGVSMPIVGPLTASVAYVDAEQDVAAGAFNPTSATVVAKLSARF